MNWPQGRQWAGEVRQRGRESAVESDCIVEGKKEKKEGGKEGKKKGKKLLSLSSIFFLRK